MATPSPKHFMVSWEELHRNARALAWRLLDIQKWDGIVAVTRGGMVPAAIIARELEIRMIDTVCASSYEELGEGAQDFDKTQDKIKILKEFDGDGKNWLVIDDLVDTGETFKVLREMIPNAHFATIYAKPQGKPTVDTYITEVSQDTWIFFPWDVELQFSQPIAQAETPAG